MTASQKTTLVRIIVVYALGVLAAMSVSEAVPQVSSIAREFHPRNPAMIGLVISMPSLVVAVGALLVGFLVDRLGDKKVLMAGALVLVAGDALVTVAPSLPGLLGGRLVSGIGYVFVAVSAITLLIRITEGKQRTLAMAIWSTFVPASFIIPFLMAGPIAAFGSWRLGFSSHAALVVVFGLLGLVLLPRRSEGQFQPSRTSGIGAVLRSPWPYVLGVSFVGNAFLQAGLGSSLASFLHRHYGADEFLVNKLNIVGQVLTILGCLLVGNLLNRPIKQLKIAGVALLLAGVPALVLFGLPVGLQASIACAWIAMFGGGMLAAMWALLPCCAPTPASMGASSGLVTQFALFGVLLSSPVYFGAQAASTPAPMLIAIGIGLLLCMCAIPVWARSPMPHAIASVGSQRLFGKRAAAAGVPATHP